MPADFSLHPQLAADTFEVSLAPSAQKLCTVRLMNDKQYPWLVLVPQRSDIREVYDLNAAEQARLWQEVTACGQALMALHKGFKLNIGALGNMVPQLHIHLIVRQEGDPAWPGPVWGANPAEPYSDDELASYLNTLSEALSS